MDRMRLAYVTPRYSPRFGGVETHVARLATRVVAQGHDVEVITQDSDRGLPALEVIDGVTVRRFLVPVPSRHFAVSPGLWAYLQHHRRFDVVHAHNYHASAALGSALAPGPRLVFSPHYHGGSHALHRQALHLPYRRLGRVIFDRACHVICMSEAEAWHVRHHFPAVVPRMTVIPNGVDVLDARGDGPDTGLSPVVLCAGRLEAHKRVDRAIRALPYLDRRFLVHIVGDGPDFARLDALATRLRVRERVVFRGHVDRETLRLCLHTASVYVSMSSHEAFGIGVLEALVSGTRVAISDIPAHREVTSGVDRSWVALLPNAATPAELARAIRRLTRERPRAHTPIVPMATSWDDVVSRTMCVYRDVMRNGGASHD